MEIRGPNQSSNQPVNLPPGLGGPQEVDKARQAGFEQKLQGTQGAQGAASASSASGSAASPAFDKLRSRIQEGIAAGHSKQEIMQTLVGEQLQERYGSAATPEMKAAVQERFATDPQMSQLFNRLYSQAAAGR